MSSKPRGLRITHPVSAQLLRQLLAADSALKGTRRTDIDKEATELRNLIIAVTQVLQKAGDGQVQRALVFQNGSRPALQNP